MEDKLLRDRSAAAEALAHTALGDHTAARSVAQGFGRDEELAAGTLAALAGHAACAPVDPGVLVSSGGMHASLARRLAAFLHPLPAGPDLARARSFLAEGLTPGGWHHAVHVLAVVAPDAVCDVRDVVFAHLGLDT